MTEPIRIAMWSGPRNISTAMMRAWENRADCRVVDEPFYAAYLAATGRDHPMRDAVIASQPTGWDEVAAGCAGAAGAPVVYLKLMCQHMVAGAPMGWADGLRHAFLIRPPEAVAASFRQKVEDVVEADLGFVRQAELFEEIARRTGREPPVVLARDVLEAPEAMLRALCAALGVAFDPAMLSWPAGPRASDGVWAAHWYRAVEETTGFGAYREPSPVPPELEEIVAASRPAYEALAARRLRPNEMV